MLVNSGFEDFSYFWFFGHLPVEEMLSDMGIRGSQWCSAA